MILIELPTAADSLRCVVLEPARVLSGEAISDDYGHDEALTSPPHKPDVVVRQQMAAEVSAIVKVAAELGVPITARGNGTAGVPRRGKRRCRGAREAARRHAQNP